MDLNRLNIFRMLTTRMNWLTARQQVLATNVANADTPEYHARDLEPLDFAELLRRQRDGVALTVTKADHIAAGQGDSTAFKARAPQQAYEAIPSGNSVVLEEEMMKVARTTANYELMANLYQKHVGLIKIAIGRGK